jgi:hypothetical protein
MGDLYTYVIQHDAGLAPNPFSGSTCDEKITEGFGAVLNHPVVSRLCGGYISRHKTSAFRRSSCSKALAIRVISAERAPTFLAASRHVEVTIATSLMISRA